MTTTQTEVRTTLEDALATARAKKTEQLTKFEFLLLGFSRDTDPKRLERAQREASAGFYAVALQRAKIAEAKASGAPSPFLDLASAETDDRFDYATALVDVMGLYGRKFWS
jgi:hypothetical protein